MGSQTKPPVSPTLVRPLAENGRFDIGAIAASLPAAAETLLADHYLTDRPEASARVFRVYRPIPPHYHATCDEFLYAFSGRGTFWLGDESTEAGFAPGQLLFFSRNTVHAVPKLFEHPGVFLSVAPPRRHPLHVIFVNPQDGTPQPFMARNAAKKPGS